MGLRILGKSSSKPCLERGMVLVLLCLHVVLSFAFSRWLSLEEGARWFCLGLLLPGWVRGFAADSLVPVQASVDVAENSGCVAYML